MQLNMYKAGVLYLCLYLKVLKIISVSMLYDFIAMSCLYSCISLTSVAEAKTHVLRVVPQSVIQSSW